MLIQRQPNHSSTKANATNTSIARNNGICDQHNTEKASKADSNASRVYAVLRREQGAPCIAGTAENTQTIMNARNKYTLEVRTSSGVRPSKASLLDRSIQVDGLSPASLPFKNICRSSSLHEHIISWLESKLSRQRSNLLQLVFGGTEGAGAGAGAGAEGEAEDVGASCRAGED